ncbi:ATP-binding cassette domain-containing protein [Treponema parvum]|uniref:ATP-binding cassette domain-containing protein n=1 Tax=Treponema parvum TaxID=138851 RepID=A0A975F1F5_9SPIR|nr:ATP-binding cassette domain-containing protein [Treponema parvum]QTQ12677.1 ATP-binding cassette domain-containing protein [Treponema parvum]
MQDGSCLISIKNCRIQDRGKVLVQNLSWTMKSGEAWLVTGPGGEGKEAFLKALSENGMSGGASCEPNDDGSYYKNVFSSSVETVSLERAAALIEEERKNDDSEFSPDGVDAGRTGRIFLAEAIFSRSVKKNEILPENIKCLENNRYVKLCGIEDILDRGLKYMSTGEIRRTLLCRSLLSEKKLLILSNPFAGLDSESRSVLFKFFDETVKERSSRIDDTLPYIILSSDRYSEIPGAINDVIEFTGAKISFCGSKNDYENLLFKREKENNSELKSRKKTFIAEVSMLNDESFKTRSLCQTAGNADKASRAERKILVEMKRVNVAWSGHVVLDDLTWSLYEGEHWLIRGPNGSGKTTFLELITGDNMQVFCNDVSLFGKRRGSGETVWDIKSKLGIVSYRMHVEYRMLGGTDLESVIISGFRDSIGLYEHKTDLEVITAEKWLNLGGFSGRKKELFGNLSYGEQRALLILRAAVKCPKILILDEPCHGLDKSYRENILNLLETIAESGTTTLLHVTHDPSEVLPCEKHILEFHPKERPMYKIIDNS